MPDVLRAAEIEALIAPYLAAGELAASGLAARDLAARDLAAQDLRSGLLAGEDGSPGSLSHDPLKEPRGDDPLRVPGPVLAAQLVVYLELLVKWNARINLTAIRDVREVAGRHFGESLFAGCALGAVLPAGATVLDLGSGAGFPGLPLQLLRPDLRVTLAESQSKKVSFLREVVRSLGLKTEVYGDRVEGMPAERRFDAVTMRAVDAMERAVEAAMSRVACGGWLAVLGNGRFLRSSAVRRYALPLREQSFLEIERL